ncbi:SNF2-related protein [Myxococcota bacterium]|nr:SNF2-related protein [Myxococcota bacterium]
MEHDPHPDYRTKRAYLYFLFRTLDLLRPGGVAAFIVPTGWLTGTSPEMRKARERVLLRHHLLGAFRLPSVPPEGGTVTDVVYDQFVTDLLIFEARGGTLAQVPASDLAILEGDYYRQHPAHVLGEEVGKDSEGWEPGQPVARRGYQVRGRFEGFPAWTPRPMAAGELAERQGSRTVKARGGISRVDSGVDVGELAEPLASAVRLGLRVDGYLAAVARQDPATAAAWPELHRDLLAWQRRHGDPRVAPGLRELADRRVVGAQRFLAAWEPGGQGLIAGLARAPSVQAVTYTGPWSIPAAVGWLYRQRGARLTVAEFCQWARDSLRRTPTPAEVVEALHQAGWCLDGDGYQDIVAEGDYLTGLLWPKLDRAEAMSGQPGRIGQIAQHQARRLRERIGWRSGPSILQELLPIDSWLPLDLVADWLAAATGARLELERKDGLLQPQGVTYALLDNTDKHRTAGLSRDALSFIGWANIDKGLWNPEREKVEDPETGKEKAEPVDDARRKQVARWMEHWTAWLQADPARLDRIELAYNRQLRGYVAPEYPSDPVDVARWSSVIRLHDYQNQAQRKLAANGCGLLAFDVGLGKTYTGLKLLAQLRQEGRAKRPVVVVPNSIVWKWHRDFAKVLPDYRVLVIGSERSIAQRGARKGRVVAAPDSPDARARKWSQFQAGEADAVLLTYSALARTQMSPDVVNRYVEGTISLRRSIVMALEQQDAVDEAEGKKKKGAPSERKAADIQERVRAWVADMLAPPRGWVYDPGIEWHALGVDFLMVDEAQNFKNLLFSEREGAERQAAKRSWALDFRCASVRAHTGGTGVFLLSATPAKNSPTEFYNLLHLVRPDLWHQVAVDNHESFLTRFGRFERKQVLDPGGQKLVERDVVVGFKNIDELRDVVNRWSTFKVAEEVGLKLPNVEVRQHTVEVTPAMQAQLHGAYSELADIEEILRKLGGRQGDPIAQRQAKALIQKKQGIALRIYMLYLHPDLPGIGTDARTILKSEPTEGPKLVECAREIVATSEQVCPRPDASERWCLDCGHIVFCDNVAVHYWMRKLLEDQGIPRERIAILNAIEAADTELRQQIVERFNGVGSPGDDDYVEPSVDVVIANAVAYEGMDLQRRTCAIHHLDVPWEPATLQQRNGRGVRQGNTFNRVVLHYYFVDGSNEPWKVQRIERKRGWMAELVEGQRRRTNTTMESEDLDAEQVEDLALAHAPPEVRERIKQARREQEAQQREARRREAQLAANRDLVHANALWRRVERERVPHRQAELRREAEEATTRALRYPKDNWPEDLPWHAQAARVRDTALFIPVRGLPLAPGDLVLQRGTTRPVEISALGSHQKEADRWDKSSKPKLLKGAWLRDVGSWVVEAGRLLPETADTMGGDYSIVLAGPEVVPEPLDDAFRHHLLGRYAGNDMWQALGWRWPESGWHRLAPTTQERWWPALAGAWAPVHLGRTAQWQRDQIHLPVDQRGALLVLHQDGAHSIPEGGRLLPPTPAGWLSFLALAEDAPPELTWTTLNATAAFWWGRSFPKRATSTPEAASAAAAK